MKPVTWFLLPLLLGVSAKAWSQQCVSQMYPNNAGNTIQIVTSDPYISASNISDAISKWETCSQFGTGFPTLTASCCGDYTFTVVHQSGTSTNSQGGCGLFQPAQNSSGAVVGGTIVVFDAQSNGVDCEPFRDVTIAHEIGHGLGLGDSNCSGYIMGAPSGTPYDLPQPDECQQVNNQWTTSYEAPANPPGCDGGIIVNPGEDCSPILINFSQGRYELTGSTDPVLFDIGASGSLVRITWTAAGADEAFIWLDRNGNGRVDDGGELFGNATSLMNGKRAINGFEALKEFDDNHDGVIDAKDAVWDRLLLWRDLNHDGVSQANEIQPIRESRVLAISLDYHWSGRRDQHGNTFRYESKVLLKPDDPFSGVVEPRPLYDIFFVPVN